MLPLLLAHIAIVAAQVPYKVRLFETFFPMQSAQDLAVGPDSPYQYYYIGQEPYLCAHQAYEPPEIPAAEPEAEVLASALDLIQSSFSPDSCVWAYELRRSYWTYALCNADKIIQYHEATPPAERGKNHLAQQPDHVFVLGRFQRLSHEVLFENQASPSQYHHYTQGDARRTSTLKDEQTSPFSYSQKVVSQLVTDGSVCDMTGQPRTIEMVYKCDSSLMSTQPQILDVHEVKVCHYRMEVHVPRLCTHESFVPDRYVQDHLVEVPCQRVAADAEASGGSFDDNLSRHVFRNHVFPVRADNRINIADHHIAALGRGFYMARSKSDPDSQNDYYNHRHVILFNGFHASLSHLNMQFAQVMIGSIGTKLLAPLASQSETGDAVVGALLEWSHTFTLIFEIYDFRGEFLGVSRISHDASRNDRVISAAILDPVTLLDNEGDFPDLVPFERPDFQAPMDMWNFQYFDEKGKPFKDETSDLAPEKKESRLLVVYNRGWENSKVKMEVVDQQTGQVLPGDYTGDDEYSFMYQFTARKSIQLKIRPIEAYQDFYGFQAEVPVKEMEQERGERDEGLEHHNRVDALSEHEQKEKTESEEQEKTESEEQEKTESEEKEKTESEPNASERLNEVMEKIVEESKKTAQEQAEQEPQMQETRAEAKSQKTQAEPASGHDEL